ncbi:hypothetical protein CHX27_14090 [Flavobacterium aurantiibacter]|uniref:Uncharacterized protein n=1 Tax=Flavobacterium aurantiibacter TaxID=2023067 RepID=A0A255ZFE5_9FLAO|nr:hypothetical protein CHX27_14090 [Flavobacterium aurantiibacter]
MYFYLGGKPAVRFKFAQPAQLKTPNGKSSRCRFAVWVFAALPWAKLSTAIRAAAYRFQKIN